MPGLWDDPDPLGIGIGASAPDPVERDSSNLWDSDPFGSSILEELKKRKLEELKAQQQAGDEQWAQIQAEQQAPAEREDSLWGRFTQQFQANAARVGSTMGPGALEADYRRRLEASPETALKAAFVNPLLGAREIADWAAYKIPALRENLEGQIPGLQQQQQDIEYGASRMAPPPEGTIEQIGAALPMSATIMGGYAVHPALGAAASYQAAFGETYKNMLDRGVDPGTANAAATGSAAIQAAIEQLGGAEAILTKPVAGLGLGKLLRRLAISSASEGGEEIAQGLTDYSARALTGEFDGQDPWMVLNAIGADLGTQGKIGALMGGILAGPAEVASSISAEQEVDAPLGTPELAPEAIPEAPIIEGDSIVSPEDEAGIEASLQALHDAFAQEEALAAQEAAVAPEMAQPGPEVMMQPEALVEAPVAPEMLPPDVTELVSPEALAPQDIGATIAPPIEEANYGQIESAVPPPSNLGDRQSAIPGEPVGEGQAVPGRSGAGVREEAVPGLRVSREPVRTGTGDEVPTPASLGSNLYRGEAASTEGRKPGERIPSHIPGRHFTTDRSAAMFWAKARGERGVLTESESSIQRPFSTDRTYTYEEARTIDPELAQMAARDIGAESEATPIPGQMIYKAAVDRQLTQLGKTREDHVAIMDAGSNARDEIMEKGGFDAIHYDLPHPETGEKVPAFVLPSTSQAIREVRRQTVAEAEAEAAKPQKTLIAEQATQAPAVAAGIAQTTPELRDIGSELKETAKTHLRRWWKSSGETKRGETKSPASFTERQRELRSGRMSAEGAHALRLAVASIKETGRVTGGEPVLGQEVDSAVNAVLDGAEIKGGKVNVEGIGEVKLSVAQQKLAKLMRSQIDRLSTEQADIFDFQANQHESEVERQIESVVSKASKSGEIGADPQDLYFAMREFINGESDVSELPAELKKQANFIRTQEPFRKMHSARNLAEIIRSNVGEYVTRAYRAYTENDYADNLRKSPEWQKHRDALRQSEPKLSEKTDSEMDNLMWAALKSGGDIDTALTKGSGLGTLSLGVFSKRKELSDAWQRFLGVYTDPQQRFVRTVQVLARNIATFRANEHVREVGLRDGWLHKESVPGTKEISGKDTRNPLGGLWVDEEIHDFVAGKVVERSTNIFVRGFQQVAGVAKWSLTVGSWQSQLRNILANPLLLVSNGMTPWGSKSKIEPWNMPEGAAPVGLFHAAKEIVAARPGGVITKGALTSALKEVGYENADTIDVDKIAEWFKKAQKYKVVNTQIEANDIRTLLRSKIDDVKAIQGIKTAGQTDVAQAVYKAPFRAANWMWQFGDDMFKLTAFTTHYNMHQWAFPNATEEQSLEWAADRTKNTMPDTDRSPQIIQMARQSGFLTNFISFISEIPRNVQNNVKYGTEDVKEGMATGNDKLVRLGKQRLAGTVMAIGSAPALKLAMGLARQALDDDDDKLSVTEAMFGESRFSPFLPEYYQRSSTPIVWKSKGRVVLLDLSFMDPYGHLRKIFGGTLKSVQNDQDFFSSMVGSFMEFAGPWMSPQFMLATFNEVQNGTDPRGNRIYLENDDLLTKIDKSTEYVYKRAAPGTIRSIGRISSAMSKKDKERAKIETLALFGPRLIVIDMDAALPSLASKLGTRDTTMTFSRSLREDLGESVRKKEMARSLRVYENSVREFIRGVNGAKYTDLSDKEIRKYLEPSSISTRDLNLAMKGDVDKLVGNYRKKLEDRLKLFEKYGDDWRKHL